MVAPILAARDQQVSRSAKSHQAFLDRARAETRRQRQRLKPGDAAT
jgi:hypothetical protein